MCPYRRKISLCWKCGVCWHFLTALLVLFSEKAKKEGKESFFGKPGHHEVLVEDKIRLKRDQLSDTVCCFAIANIAFKRFFVNFFTNMDCAFCSVGKNQTWETKKNTNTWKTGNLLFFLHKISCGEKCGLIENFFGKFFATFVGPLYSSQMCEFGLQ